VRSITWDADQPLTEEYLDTLRKYSPDNPGVHRDRDAVLRGVLDPEAYHVRSTTEILPRDVKWTEALQPMIEAPRTRPGAV
jgi:hypothetical protein